MSNDGRKERGKERKGRNMQIIAIAAVKEVVINAAPQLKP